MVASEGLLKIGGGRGHQDEDRNEERGMSRVSGDDEVGDHWLTCVKLRTLFLQPRLSMKESSLLENMQLRCNETPP